ncbi:MAG: AAA family ATPase [Pseudonocardiaceae bacterium]
MVEAADVWGHPMRTFGFPNGREFGVWHAGRLLGRQAAGWIQAQLAEPTGYRIEQGFSGAPVWDDELGGVVGMVVAAESSTTPAGYLIPTETLLGGWPELRALARPAAPYRGLAPFQESDRAVFFGRGKEITELVELMGGPGPVTVVGPSGCGKSSLVFAGLLPALKGRDDGGPLVVTFRPSSGRTVYTAVAAALLPILEPELTEADRLRELATLAGVLQAQGLADVVARILEWTGAPELVVVLDQGEELLAQHPGQAEQLCEQLLGPAAPARMRVLLTVRADFLDAALSSPALSGALRRSVYTLGAMSAAQLHAVVVEPLADIPGVEFQDGLVERILADVGTDPGALPLLGLALTLLWERQTGGRLTHEAYENLGRVPGSLGRYAEDVWSRNGLADDEETARQMFLRLVQVSSGGEVTRRVATSDDLGAVRWELAQRLATTRLLVTGRDAEGRETVELAHEALVDGWVRLRGWIDADRDFLAWQEQFDRQLKQWESTKGDQGAFLRGVALAAAEEWLRSRPADISVAGRRYVEVSQTRQRRDVRRWRVVTAVLTVLVLTAGALTGVALNRGNQLQRELNSAVARALGEESLARATDDPATAMQLALAAWRADPSVPQARTALGRQYLAMQSVNKTFDGLSDVPTEAFLMSQDGRVMLLPHSQGFAVVTGLDGSAPEQWIVRLPTGSRPTLSADGDWLAVVDPQARVLIWDVRRRSGPDVLWGGQQTPVDSSWTSFSPDSRRLVWLAPPATDGRRELVIWDVAERTRITHPVQWMSERDINRVWLTDDPDLALFRYGDPESDDSRLVVLDLSTGAEVRAMAPKSAVIQHGRSVISCADRLPDQLRATAYVLRSDTSEEVLRFPLHEYSCGGLARVYISVDGNYLVEVPSSLNDHSLGKVTDLSDGSVYDVVTPPDALRPGSAQNLFTVNQPIGFFPSGEGRVTMLLGRGSTVLRMNDLTSDPRGPLKYHATSLSDDGRYLVITLAEGTHTVLDRGTGQELGRLPYAEIEHSDQLTSVTVSDSLSFLITKSENFILSQYSLPELERYSRYVLPTPIDGRAASAAAAVEHDGRLVALTDGVLSVWDTRTRTILGEPVRLDDSPEETAWYRRHSGLNIWPGDPNQVAIVAPDGSLELWDIEQRQRVRTIPTRIDQGYNVIFDNTGDRVASRGENGMLEVWDAETGQALRAPIAVPDVTRLLGFDSAGRVVTENESDKVVEFWDIDTGRQSGLLRLAAPIDEDAAVEEGRRLMVSGNFGLPYELPIIAQAWFDHLCRSFDRGFTESERALLPSGTDLDPPCSTNR